MGKEQSASLFTLFLSLSLISSIYSADCLLVAAIHSSLGNLKARVKVRTNLFWFCSHKKKTAFATTAEAVDEKDAGESLVRGLILSYNVTTSLVDVFPATCVVAVEVGFHFFRNFLLFVG
jgi:hypothetical protein